MNRHNDKVDTGDYITVDKSEGEDIDAPVMEDIIKDDCYVDVRSNLSS